MCNSPDRKMSLFWCLLLITFALSACVSNKRTVDAYRDRSYTRSGAEVAADTAAPDADQQRMPKQSPAIRSAVRPQMLPTSEITADALLPLLTLVDDRIVEYEGKVEQWQKFSAEAATVNLDQDQQDKISHCQRRLLTILNGYNELHQQLISESSGQPADVSVFERFVAAERQDIGFMESDCQLFITGDLQSGGWIAGTMGRLLDEKERELQEKMAAGEYQQVIELYESLPLEEEQEAAYETTYNYGQALLRTGREEKAAEVFQELLITLQKKDQMEREFKLMQLIADIHFGIQDYEKAFERYIDIINRYAGLSENIDWARKQQSVISARNSRGIEVRNFAELMRSYLTYNPDRDAFKVFLMAQRFLGDFPDSSMVPTVNHILYESKDRAEAWFAMVLQRINMLKGEKKYQEALQIVENLDINQIPRDKKELLSTLSDELTVASYEEEESKRLAEEEAMQDIWNRGQEYLRAKEYDRAIAVFSTILDTAYGVRANDKIVEASQLAAQEDRRMAAEFFVEAGRTNDENNRIALLFKSRQLLQGILKKYPRSGLLDKTEKNLERIEAEIRSIDPDLLIEPEGSADGRESLQEPVETRINGVPIGKWKEQVWTGYPQD